MRQFNLRRSINHIKNKYSGGLNFRKRRRKFQGDKVFNYGVLVAEIAGTILLAFLLVEAFTIRLSVAGESMAPTLEDGNTVMLNKVSYLVGGPKTNDVIAFFPAGNANAKCSIKRVVGVPGDTIVIQRGSLYVNGEIFVDQVDTESITDAGLASAQIVLKDGEYFVLGDNRNNSEDSRYDTIGNVQKADIVGKVWFKVSFGNFGFME